MELFRERTENCRLEPSAAMLDDIFPAAQSSALHCQRERTLGVGVGGEDRHEIEVCGVDPSTRGRRTNESIEIIRALMTGQPIDYSGEFFDLEWSPQAAKRLSRHRPRSPRR